MIDQSLSAPTARAVERALVVVAGVLVAVCPYLTWIRVIVLGGLDLPMLLTLSGYSGVGTYLLTAAGVAIGLTALLLSSILAVRLVSLAVALIGLLAAGPTAYDLVSAAAASHGLAEVGGGLICGVVGLLLALVAPLVGVRKDRSVGLAAGRVRSIHAWFPATVGVCVMAGLLLLPVRASEANYCGLPIASWVRPLHPLPSPTPPSSVESTLRSDQASVTDAQEALATEEQRSSGVEAEVSSAQSLETQAQTAEQQTQDASNTVSTDEATVSSDQGDVDAAGGTVDGDQATVSYDDNAIQYDQNAITSDQQSGWSTSFDEQQLSNDQGKLANDQQTLQQDQAAEQTAQSRLNQDSSVLARDKQAADTASRNATALQQQADQASTKASQDDGVASQAHDQATQSLSDAQNQLANDRNSWSQEYEREVADAKSLNLDLAACRMRSQSRLVISAIAMVLAVVTTGIVTYRRRAVPVAQGALPTSA